jgi:CRP/FNR family transcriptional regulator
MLDRREALSRVVFLKGLPAAVQDEIAAAGEERRLRRGECLFCEHERCIGLLVVLSGAVKVYKLDARGRELTIGVEGPGASVADLPLFDGGNYPASADAVDDDTRVFVVPRERFTAVMAAHPEIAQQAVRALAVGMRKLMEMLKAQTLHSVRARLAEYLLHAAGDEVTFPLRDTNEAIGSQVGTVREVVSRTLRSLEDAGAITLHGGRRVTIRDRAVLRQIAGQG